MTNRINFTKRNLDSIAPPAAGRQFIYDSKTPGLAFRITSAGARGFYLYRSVNGRPTKIKLGGYPEMTVDQARRVAAKINSELAEGRNVTAERRAARKATSFKEMFDYYLEHHAKPRKRTWREDERQFNRYLKTFGSKRLVDIKRETVRSLHSRIGKENGRYAANRVLALISAVYNKVGEDVGYAGENPARGVEKFAEKSRDRYLTATELKRFFESLEAEPDGSLRDFFKVTLLTGARVSNVRAMRWEELDLEQGVWTLAREVVKTDEELSIPLSPDVKIILKSRKEEQERVAQEKAKEKGGKACLPEYVFPGRHGKGHLVEPRKAWVRMLERAKIKELHIHDLRRTLGSWMKGTGANLEVIGDVLGHKSSASTKIYARMKPENLIRESLNRATAAIMRAATGQSGEDDVQESGQEPDRQT